MLFAALKSASRIYLLPDILRDLWPWSTVGQDFSCRNLHARVAKNTQPSPFLQKLVHRFHSSLDVQVQDALRLGGDRVLHQVDHLQAESRVRNEVIRTRS